MISLIYDIILYILGILNVLLVILIEFKIYLLNFF